MPQSGGSWTAGAGIKMDLMVDSLRPDTWTSTDAAGLPILPGLLRYDEVAQERFDMRSGLRLRRRRRRTCGRRDMMRRRLRIRVIRRWAAVSPEGERRHLGLLARQPGDSACAATLRNDSGRQRKLVVPDWESRQSMER